MRSAMIFSASRNGMLLWMRGAFRKIPPRTQTLIPITRCQINFLSSLNRGRFRRGTSLKRRSE